MAQTEILNLRDEFAKHFETDDPRQRVAVVGPEPLHYRHPDGYWADMADLVQSVAGGWAGVTSTVRFGVENGYLTISYAGRSMQMRPLAVVMVDRTAPATRYRKIADADYSRASKAGNTITVADIFPGVDLSVSIDSRRMSKSFTIREKPTLPDPVSLGWDPTTTYVAFVWDVNVPNGAVIRDTVTDTQVGYGYIGNHDLVVEAAGQPVVYFLAGTSTGANGRMRPVYYASINATVPFAEAMPYARTQTASYPLVVDPTTSIVNIGTGTGTLALNDYTAVSVYASTQVTSGEYDTGAKTPPYHLLFIGYFKFDLTSLAGKTVTAADITPMPVTSNNASPHSLYSIGDYGTLDLGDWNASGSLLGQWTGPGFESVPQVYANGRWAPQASYYEISNLDGDWTIGSATSYTVSRSAAPGKFYGYVHSGTSVKVAWSAAPASGWTNLVDTTVATYVIDAFNMDEDMFVDASENWAYSLYYSRSLGSHYHVVFCSAYSGEKNASDNDSAPLAVVYGNSKWLALNVGRSSHVVHVYEYAASTWTLQSTTGLPTSGCGSAYGRAIYNNGNYIVSLETGSAGVGGNRLFYSSNGYDWTNSGYNIRVVAVNGTTIIGIDNSQNIRRSTDGGVTWGTSTSNYPHPVDQSNFGYDGTNFYAFYNVGDFGGRWTRAKSTDDGVTWNIDNKVMLALDTSLVQAATGSQLGIKIVPNASATAAVNFNTYPQSEARFRITYTDAVLPWVSPSSGSTVAPGTAIVWTSLVASKRAHFRLQLADDANFTTNLVTLTSYTDSGFEYWDGGAWQPLGATGMPANMTGNNVRYTNTSSLRDGSGNVFRDTLYRRVAQTA